MSKVIYCWETFILKLNENVTFGFFSVEDQQSNLWKVKINSNLTFTNVPSIEMRSKTVFN